MIYSIVIKDAERTNSREYSVDIPELLMKDDTYDSLNINSNGDVTITRRIGIYNSGITYILETEEVQGYDNINIVLFEGINYIYLKDNSNTVLSVSYILKNDYTNVFATRVEMNTRITQTAQEINLEVSKKVGEDEIISKINQSPEAVKIQAKKISLEGTVTANEKFKINLDGSVETTDLRLADGGRVIGGTGIYTNLQFLGEFSNVGFSYNYSTSANKKTILDIYATIPENFTIMNAIVTIIHQPEYDYLYSSESDTGAWYWGYSRNLGIFTSEVDDFYSEPDTDYDPDLPSMTLIEGALNGNNTWQPSTPTDTNHKGEQISSSNIKEHLERGKTNRLIIASNDDAPEATGTYYQEMIKCAQRTGRVYAILDVFGYMSLAEKEGSNEEEENDLEE